MKRLYWKLYWEIRQRREQKLVEQLLNHLAHGVEVVYIHPNAQSGPVAALTKLEHLKEIDGLKAHSHLEGK